jgi:hypothetical protein
MAALGFRVSPAVAKAGLAECGLLADEPEYDICVGVLQGFAEEGRLPSIASCCEAAVIAKAVRARLRDQAEAAGFRLPGMLERMQAAEAILQARRLASNSSRP